MRAAALDVLLHGEMIGYLIELGSQKSEKVCRFVPLIDSVALDTYTLSLSFAPRQGSAPRDVWASYATDPDFTGAQGRLPVFFQNMLPEGVFRDHIAQLRGCAKDDYFEILAACGKDLPGAVAVRPSSLDANQIGSMLMRGNESVEATVVQAPTQGAISLSGMQPKLALCFEKGRYVTRSRLGPTRIIGKLPQSDRPHLPEAEMLGLALASAAGVSVVKADLQPIELLAKEDVGLRFDLASKFLAVERFDRNDQGDRIHCEDFAQVFAVAPEDKYTGAAYAGIARVLLDECEGKIESVKELVRMITVNDLLGNPDGHLKNFCLIYPDRKTPVLSPAFDVVPFCAYLQVSGAGLSLAKNSPKNTKGAAVFTPESVRLFAEAVGVPEKVVSQEVKRVLGKAKSLWPDLIRSSSIPTEMKQRVLDHFGRHALIVRPDRSRAKVKSIPEA